MGISAIAAAMPSCRIPSTIPNRRSNQNESVLPLSSPSAPGPSIRNRQNATTSDSQPCTQEVTRQAKLNRLTTTSSMGRKPCRSVCRPMYVIGTAPNNVPRV
jgi:hypothetical protein